TEFMELCGDKQLWHNYLVKNGLGDYLLPTRPYSPANLRTMLRRYPLLFLKPRVGYEARGILRIAQGESLPAYNNTPHAIHWFSSARHRELQTGTCHFNSREGVLRSWEYTREAEFTAELQKLDFSGYIIQQGVHPATWRGHIFELRLIMQHDGIGWRCLGKVLRLTGRANLPLITADRETWQEALPVLQELFPGQGAALLQQSEEVAHQLAQSFSSGAMEFSLDFLIDTTARLWILEGNGKPSSFLVQIGDYHGRRHSLAAKLSFAQKLYLNTLPVSGTETQNDNRGTHQLIGS
ncbi:MAG: YheC/YheD family protein, partial [Symbiobacteriaceae bacterium]|nr:YheC/YheD family protein [Symbiobacteriaceae bacterium]